MRFLPFLLVALPLAAALPASTDNASLEARAAKSCTQSSQCGSVNNFCNRSKCDTRKSLGASCYKDIGVSFLASLWRLSTDLAPPSVHLEQVLERQVR
jgi:hypothetical protein